MPADPADDLGIVDALAQLSFLVQGALARYAAEHDLSMVQVRLLGVLRDREPTMLELARLLDLDKSSVSGLVDRAERRGLVRRVRSSHDGRSSLVRLTAAGRRLVNTAAIGFADQIAELTAHLGAAEETTLSTLASSVVLREQASRAQDRV
jgi:MarR family transcriptional regulator, lower aerobic nicotinate degradation pathway regulator